MKFYTAKYDRVFKTIFCDDKHPELMREFLSRILNKKVENIKFLRNEIPISGTDEKVKTVDVFCLVDEVYTHIEINSNIDSIIHIRNFIYFSTLYANNIKRGQEYNDNNQFIHLDFSYVLGNQYDIREEYRVQNSKSMVYVSNFSIVEFNMDKAMKFWHDKDEKNIKKYKELIILDSDISILDSLSKGDGFVEQFKDKIEDLNDDTRFQTDMTREEDQLYLNNTYKRKMNEAIALNKKKDKVIEKKDMLIQFLVQKASANGTSKEEIQKILGMSKEELEKLL